MATLCFRTAIWITHVHRLVGIMNFVMYLVFSAYHISYGDLDTSDALEEDCIVHRL